MLVAYLCQSHLITCGEQFTHDKKIIGLMQESHYEWSSIGHFSLPLAYYLQILPANEKQKRVAYEIYQILLLKRKPGNID